MKTKTTRPKSVGWHAMKAVLKEKVTVVNSYIKEERSRTSLVVHGVRNPPTGSESMGSIPGPESFHMMQASTTTKAWVP